MSRETKKRRQEREHFLRTCDLILTKKLRKKNLRAWRALRAGQSYRYPVGGSNSKKRW